MPADTVAVGCKLPKGIRLTIKSGASVTLAGPVSPTAIALPLNYDYAITLVDKSFWDAWLKEVGRNGNGFPPFRSGAIFVQPTQASAQAAGAERVNDVKTGLEGGDPVKAVKGITKEDEGKATGEAK
jgi:hypothetical protein